MGEEHFQNQKLKCDFIPDNFKTETHSFHQECYQTFVKNKTLCKWKALLEKESKTDDNYPTQSKSKKFTEDGARDVSTRLFHLYGV